MSRNWLRALRKEKRATQKQLGIAAGISASHYCLIEAGGRRPSVEIAKKIAEALNFKLHGFDWTKFYEAENAGREDI